MSARSRRFRTLLVASLFVVVAPVKASAACAWVLWEGTASKAAMLLQPEWKLQHPVYDSRRECQVELDSMIARGLDHWYKLGARVLKPTDTQTD
jgi:hypothetical protein